MRTREDRQRILERFRAVFGEVARHDEHPALNMSDSLVQVGYSWLHRSADADPEAATSNLAFLHSMLHPLEHVVKCVERRWPAVLVGGPASGKTSLVRLLAQTAGRKLHEFAMTSSADSTELLGCFEQVDLSRHKKELLARVRSITYTLSASLLATCANESLSTALESIKTLLQTWSTLQVPREIGRAHV